MRIPVAMVTVVIMGAAGLSGTAHAMQAQPQPAPPGGQGGAIGGVQRPNRPAQPGPGPQGRGPVRDPRQPPAEGTATVRGRVVDAATGAGIPRAKVRINGRDPRSTRVVTTDTEGLFTLTKVPAGFLALTVDKATYVPTMYPDRRRTMRASGVNIADGQTIDNITIQLSRGSAITGRIVDMYGDPVEGVMVYVVPAQSNRAANQVRFGGMRSFQTSNDIGEYRISRLEPGQYFLLAIPQRGRMGGEDSSAAAGRTYYPGVATIDQAQPITIERGGSIGADFQMLETTLTRVSGVVLTAKGAPARGGHVNARTTNATKGTPAGLGMGMPDGGSSGVDQSGAFELTLQPGEYVIEGMAAPGEEGPRTGRFEQDRGQVKLMVGGESISGVTIATGTGGTVSGRFVFKGSGTPPTSFAGLNIGFGGPNGNSSGEDCRAYDRAQVNPDGTFSAENIWGTCQIRPAGATRGWAFEAITHSGNDITTRVIEFGPGRSLTGVEVVFSDRIGELAVTVADERGTPTQDYVAIAFPIDKEKWGDQRFMRFQVRSAANTPNTQTGGTAGPTGAQVMPMATLVQGGPYAGMINSTFMGPGMGPGGGNSFTMLLAGDYFAVALEDAAPEDLRDPEYLERLSQIATRVSVSAGGQEPVQLRRVKAPE